MKEMPEKEMPDEWISAYLDDEMSPLQRHRGVQELCRDQDARDRLGRYQLIGDAIRYDLPEHLEPRFAMQMRDAVKAEVAQSHEPPHWSIERFFYWILHPGPKVAFASVAAVALMVGLWGMAGLLEESKQMTAYTTTIVEPELVHSKDVIKEHHRAVQLYLATHAEYAAPQAMLPYLQLVDYGD